MRLTLIAQTLLIALIINTAFFVVPTVNAVNGLSLQQLSSKIYLEEYTRLKAKEDLFGAINMLMTIILYLMIVFQTKWQDS